MLTYFAWLCDFVVTVIDDIRGDYGYSSSVAMEESKIKLSRLWALLSVSFEHCVLKGVTLKFKEMPKLPNN